MIWGFRVIVIKIVWRWYKNRNRLLSVIKDLEINLYYCSYLIWDKVLKIYYEEMIVFFLSGVGRIKYLYIGFWDDFLDFSINIYLWWIIDFYVRFSNLKLLEKIKGEIIRYTGLGNDILNKINSLGMIIEY